MRVECSLRNKVIEVITNFPLTSSLISFLEDFLSLPSLPSSPPLPWLFFIKATLGQSKRQSQCLGVIGGALRKKKIHDSRE